MPKQVLTDRFCIHAKVALGQLQTDYFDAKKKGLALRVTKDGTRSWTYLFTLGGRRVRMTFGTYPATSLAKAHTRADEAKAALEEGRDPRAVLAKPATLKAIGDDWAEREGAGLRTGEGRKATLARLVYPDLGGRPIGDIRRSDIVRLLDKIEDESGPVMADQTLAFLRRVFNWHASRDDDFRSPIVRGMARTKPRERARARILTDDEIRVVWRVAEGHGAFGRLVRFLLLTGARRTEAAAMPWAELDGAEWTLPGPRNKTKLDLLRTLPKAALAVLGAKPEMATYVFSTDRGATALSGFSKFKREFDRAVFAELRKSDLKAKPLPNFTLHDLRRTARSLMSRAGVPTDHAERVLGHVIGGVRATYDRHDFADEKRAALEKLAALVDRIISGRPTALRLVRVQRDAKGSEADAVSQ
ncbi:site-specific integrase [uncultured Bradyrhizobium sp.]|jgi:integrase|uniref:tyrosine-type recombinase/integrase n=1 Tax=uncultured Bradyrhizobium sp. TaxID=199684 RepID=UPI00261C4E06|nr:site-specific integrase [uncultured Bradyrhizobium sp.]